MKQRIITAIFIVLFSILLLVLSGTLFLPIAVGALCAIANFELFRCTGIGHKGLIAFPAYILAFGLPLGAYFSSKSLYTYFAFTAGTLFVYLMYLFLVAVFSHGRRRVGVHAPLLSNPEEKSTLSEGGIHFKEIALAYTGTTYVTVSLTTLVLLRTVANAGVYIFALVFVISWMTDVSAYFVGSLLGKHKLIPEISPKKSVEGAIGGVIGGVIGGLVLATIMYFFCADYKPNFVMFAVVSFVGSIVSQIGDLIASLIKRECGIKDYGNLFPGHGGVLDRYDSIIAVSTILFLFCFLENCPLALVIPVAA